jgi:hypothetical protein
MQAMPAPWDATLHILLRAMSAQYGSFRSSCSAGCQQMPSSTETDLAPLTVDVSCEASSNSYRNG